MADTLKYMEETERSRRDYEKFMADVEKSGGLYNLVGLYLEKKKGGRE
jgi:hypothetical protein